MYNIGTEVKVGSKEGVIVDRNPSFGTYTVALTNGELKELLQVEFEVLSFAKEKKENVTKQIEKKAGNGMLSKLGLDSKMVDVFIEQMKIALSVEKLNGKVAVSLVDGTIAVKRGDGQYVNVTADGKIYNTNGLVIEDLDDLVYAIPTLMPQVGDIIVNKNSFIQVQRVENSCIRGIDLATGRGAKVIKETNLIGVGTYKKVFSLTQFGGSNPFIANIVIPKVLQIVKEKADFDFDLKSIKDKVDAKTLLLIVAVGIQTLPYLPEVAFAIQSNPLVAMAKTFAGNKFTGMFSGTKQTMTNAFTTPVNEVNALKQQLAGSKLASVLNDFGALAQNKNVVSEDKDEEIARLRAQIEAMKMDTQVEVKDTNI